MIVKQIVIHHTASSRDRTTLQDVNAWHKLRWADFKSSLGYWVGYHYLITGDGKITQTRRDNEMGAHCIPNDGKLGVCLTGNFMLESPSDAQIKSLDELTTKLCKDYRIEYVTAHREVSNTECPGDNLMKWLNTKKQISLLQKLIGLYKIVIELLLKR